MSYSAHSIHTVTLAEILSFNWMPKTSIPDLSLAVWFLLKIFQVILHMFLDSQLQSNKDSFSLHLNSDSYWKDLFTIYTLLSFHLQASAHRMSWLIHSSDRKLIPSSLPHAEKCSFCHQWAEPTHPSGKLHKDGWYRGRRGKKTGQHLKVISD